MANGFQRVIYNLANAVPLAVMTALAWHLEFKSWGVPAILIVAAATVTVLFAICFSYGSKNCSVKSINVSKITSKFMVSSLCGSLRVTICIYGYVGLPYRFAYSGRTYAYLSFYSSDYGVTKHSPVFCRLPLL